jgi:hypothetical protein
MCEHERMKQKLSLDQLVKEVARLDALVKKYEAAGMPKLVNRYRRQLVAALSELAQQPSPDDAPRVFRSCGEGVAFTGAREIDGSFERVRK